MATTKTASKALKLEGISGEDLLNFKMQNHQSLNCGLYIVSANNQEFICYKLTNQKYKYIKLERNNQNNYEELKQIEILYYNFQPLKFSLPNCRQIKYLIKENILKNFLKLQFNKLEILRPVYISNNQLLF